MKKLSFQAEGVLGFHEYIRKELKEKGMSVVLPKS